MAAVLLILAAGVAGILFILGYLTEVFSAPDVHDFGWFDDEAAQARVEIAAVVDAASDEQIMRLWDDLNDLRIREAIERLELDDD